GLPPADPSGTAPASAARATSPGGDGLRSGPSVPRPPPCGSPVRGPCPGATPAVGDAPPPGASAASPRTALERSPASRRPTGSAPCSAVLATGTGPRYSLLAPHPQPTPGPGRGPAPP